MSNFTVYFALICLTSLISVNCIPVPSDSEEVNDPESVEIPDVVVENTAEIEEPSRVAREAKAGYRSHHHHHHHRPYGGYDGGYGGGCGYNCGGGGGFSGSAAQAGASSFNGGFGGFGGGGSSASAQSASFNVNSPFGNFGASQAFANSNSFGRKG